MLLIWGPWWMEGHHLKESKGELVSSAGIIAIGPSAHRPIGFRTVAIAIVVGAAPGLWCAHNSHQQTEKVFRRTQDRDRERVELTREGQVIDRYVEAIKLLASATPRATRRHLQSRKNKEQQRA
ncbi:hypothetical protein ACIHCV_21810 [Streptomyces sp. NPDC051956]|uniref:hypothetical protein n=1 Tax=Streptomyces sp. NPDC051956 TaxID=3365677 RepID=UPI0037D0D96E